MKFDKWILERGSFLVVLLLILAAFFLMLSSFGVFSKDEVLFDACASVGIPFLAIAVALMFIIQAAQERKEMAFAKAHEHAFRSLFGLESVSDVFGPFARDRTQRQIDRVVAGLFSRNGSDGGNSLYAEACRCARACGFDAPDPEAEV